MSATGAQSLVPARAIVTPRGSPATGGEVLPLEKYIRDLHRTHPIISIVGPSGSGKTTAIRHLAHELRHLPITFLDQEMDSPIASPQCVVFSIGHTPQKVMTSIDLQLAPWGESERVDYLLAKHPTKIRSIMKRLEGCDCIEDIEGSPRLWAAILDWMARKEDAADVRHFVRVMISTVLDMFGSDEPTARRVLAAAAASPAAGYGFVPAVLQHPFVARLTLADTMRRALLEPSPSEQWWDFARDPTILKEVARQIGSDPAAIQSLIRAITCVDRHTTGSAMLATMVMINPSYRPKTLMQQLSGLYVPGAKWSGVSLPDATLIGADLRCADLSMSTLEHGNFKGANGSRADFSSAKLCDSSFLDAALHETTFRNANMKRAVLVNAVAIAANFNQAQLQAANLSNANLQGASFIGSNLSRAHLYLAQLSAVDFTDARLDFASLRELDLRPTILNGVQANSADFHRAILEGMTIDRLTAQKAEFHSADLTGLSLTRANLRGAYLHSAGLADIDWEGADLRDVIFNNAAFHMGSSRSGNLDSPIACEGSRTGYYTDDAGEIYKHPEEIRKANLCGCDLIGAKVDKADWYLVDLRGAKYTADQARWFRKCRAILFDR